MHTPLQSVLQGFMGEFEQLELFEEGSGKKQIEKTIESLSKQIHISWNQEKKSIRIEDPQQPSIFAKNIFDLTAEMKMLNPQICKHLIKKAAKIAFLYINTFSQERTYLYRELSKDMDFVEKLDLITLMISLPSTDLEIKSRLYRTLSENMGENERFDLIHAIKLFPLTDLKTRIELYRRLSKGMTSMKRGSLITLITDLPSANLETGARLCQETSENMNPNERLYLVHAIKVFPSNDLEVRVQLYKNLSKDMSSIIRLDLIHLISDLPPNDLEEKARICQEISEDMDTNERLYLVHAIKDFPLLSFERKIHLYKNLSKNMNSIRRLELIHLIKHFPQNHFEMKARLCLELSVGMDPNEKYHLAYAIRFFSVDDLETRARLYKKLSKGMASLKKFNFAWVIKMIPMTQSTIIAMESTDVLTKSTPDILNRILVSSRRAKQEIFDYWKTILDSHHEKNAKMLAHWILENFIFLEEEQNYIQQRIFEITTLSKEDSKNPYMVHAQHLSNRKREIQIPESIYWNTSKFQGIGKKKEFRIKNLPQNVSKEYAAKMYEDLHKKAQENLLLQGRIHLIIDEVGDLERVNVAMDKFEGLWNAFFSPEIQYLLERNGDEEEVVSDDKAKLFAIIHYIQSLDSTSKSNELSIQEENFLQAISMICTCSTGKKEGISRFYSDLSKEFTLSSVKEENSLETFLKECLKREVEKKLSPSSQFIKEITSCEEVFEPPHQSLYIRNLLSCFFEFPVVFDPYSQMVHNSIFQMNPETALIKLFESLRQDSKAIKKRLKKSLNEKLAIDKPFYNSFIRSLEELSMKLDTVFSSIDQGKVKISNKGLDLLLIRSQFITSES